LIANFQQDVNERTNLTSSNKLELLLFRLGANGPHRQSELYGINVFKIREIVAMPQLTAVAGSHANLLGVANLRGDVLPVIDLPSVIGSVPETGLNIMLVTEYARTTQAFAVETVEEIVRLDWSQVLSAEECGVRGMCTSIARIDDPENGPRLVQVLDVEQILRTIMQPDAGEIDVTNIGPQLLLRHGTVILAADDSVVARMMIEAGLTAMGAAFIMTKTGMEAWMRLQDLATSAETAGGTARDKVALVLTDLEMPGMDGFTLTRNIKRDPRFKGIPVVIHSSLSGNTNEDHVRSVGADGYVAKFVAEDLAAALRSALAKV
jgi:two-component system chemotaxis response regulator CheV